MRLPSAWPRKLDLRPRNITKSFLRSASSTSVRTDFQANDAKWQAIWQDKQPSASGAKEKKYVLPMFAYPSGSLHMGHLRVYTISDVLARYHRMKGYDVLHPTGWDAFGLPAENAAIERGIDPGQWTIANIEKMKGQLKSMNTQFDWEREISTCYPSFYKHTQKLFLMLYKKGFAYQAEALVNYDPVDKTVLANEQVDNNGRSWRSGALVEQRMLKQWFFRITAFQQALLDDLDSLAKDNKWPDRVLQQQRHWIGRSTGATIRFEVELPDGSKRPVNVFTTRPDTLFGVTYLALSLSHPIVQGLAKTNENVAAFLARKASFGPDSKEGLELPITAINPASKLSSDVDSNIKVFTAPYVLGDYGEGAVMGVPAHDTRDYSFWKLHKPDEPVPLVVMPTRTDDMVPVSSMTEAYTDHGILTSSCGPYVGMPSRSAGHQIISDLQQHGAKHTETWRLRDWLISRQRYWGTPIPIVHCPSCGAVPVPDSHLPVTLPSLGPTIQGQKGNPLDTIPSFVNTTCPSCNHPAKRETDTMDTFVDSSWYYARFPDAQNPDQLFSAQSAENWLPVTIYIGGVEHAILHLLYARFIYKFLCKESEGLIPSSPNGINEPFSRLIAQGMVHGKTYSDPSTGRFLKLEDLAPNNNNNNTTDPPLVKTTGQPAAITWEKMSKSKHNGVDPISCFEKYGADVTRAHMLFAAPLSEVLLWDEEKIVGVQRWHGRVSRLVDDLLKLYPAETAQHAISGDQSLTLGDVKDMKDSVAELVLLTNNTVVSVTHTIDHNLYSVNTVVSDLIKLTNAIHDVKVLSLGSTFAPTVILTLVKLLAPIAPAFAEQCLEDMRGQNIGKKGGAQTSIFDTPWPNNILSGEDEKVLRGRRTMMTCAVQINGKVKFTVKVPRAAVGSEETGDESRQRVVDAVLGSEMGSLWLRERNDWEGRKSVFVVGGGRVVNVVF